MPPDVHSITRALFLPMLYWTGAVTVVSLLGYPDVVCITPLAWLLALPVGLRLASESRRPLGGALAEAAVAGGLLGLWQAVLAALVTGGWRFAPGVNILPAGFGASPPHPLLVALAAGLVSAPVTAGLAMLTAWLRRSRQGGP